VVSALHRELTNGKLPFFGAFAASLPAKGQVEKHYCFGGGDELLISATVTHRPSIFFQTLR
jgi:hypothetical protein